LLSEKVPEGVFVQSASQDEIAAILMGKLELDGIIPYHVIEIIVVLGCGIVKYAAENANSEALQQMEQNLAETKHYWD